MTGVELYTLSGIDMRGDNNPYRNGFMASKYYICGVAVIAHHNKYITPDNITNRNITLNWDNLEAVCIECYNGAHGTGKPYLEGLMFD